jgi:hypothetical protein
MKSKIILTLILVYLTSNLLFGYDRSRMLYGKFDGETNELIKVKHNDLLIDVKIFCYDGVPYKGEVFQAEIQEEVNYWNKEHLIQTGKELSQGVPLRFLLHIKIEDTYISFEDVNKINMYMVNALTGDTSLMYAFPKPITRIDTLQKRKYEYSDITNVI